MWDGTMVGRQFRTFSTSPIYTIASFTDATHITLDDVWGGATASGVGYEIYGAYYTPPEDFYSFVSVYDPQFNWQLWLNVGQDELNAYDAQRANTGDAYVVAQATYDTSTPPRPRYELWPHTKSARVYPFLYEADVADLEDSGASLPRFIRGDVLLEMALAQASRWPGPSLEQVNPYFNLALARDHERKSEQMIAAMEVSDDEVYMQDVRYSSVVSLPFAPMDASWLQRHAL